MADITLPALPVVLGTALVDSINPCAIGVEIFLLATLLSLGRDRQRMLTVGLIYITAVFVTYLAAGFGLLYFVHKLGLAEPLGWFVGIFVIILGLVEVKDFFWYGKGFSLQIPAGQSKKIVEYVEKISVPGAVFLGFFVALVELPCTGGPYLAITTLLAQRGFDLGAAGLLLLYNVVFMLPEMIILGLVYFGLNTDKVQEWKEEEKKWMRFWAGVVMIALGVALILWSEGLISFTLS